MKTRTTRIASGLLLSAALGLSTVALGSTAATAASIPCPIPDSAGWSLVFDGVCQITAGADTTVTVPAGVEKLQAVLVGAGGSSYYDGVGSSAAGGGGAVVYSAYPGALPNATSFDLGVTVGRGVLGQTGGTTSLDDGQGWAPNAAGGRFGTNSFVSTMYYNFGGDSGSGFLGHTAPEGTDDAPGGGAFGNATGTDPGVGVLDFGDLAGYDSSLDLELWPDTYESNNVISAGAGFGGSTSSNIPGIGSGASSLSASGGGGGMAILRVKFVDTPAPGPEIALSASSVQQNGQVTITVSGLDPNEAQLSAEVHSTPFPLGTTTANATGVATWVFTVPANFPAGQHTVIVTRGAHGGQTLSLPLEVVRALANTGGGDATMLWAAAGALGIAGLAVFSLRRRRA